MKNITKNKFFKSTLCLCLIVSLFSRCLIFYVASVSHLVLDERTAEGLWRLKTPFFNLFAVWDSAYYLEIAKYGYNFERAWIFYPLYPLFLRIFSFPLASLVNEPLLIAGFFLSNISFIFLIIYFYKLTNLLFKNEKIAYLSTVFMSIFPSSFFFSVVYTESLFMFLTIASFYYMEKNNWKISTILAMLSGLTRPMGFLIFIPMFYRMFSLIKKRKSFIIYPLLALFSPLIFLVYGYFMTNDLLINLHTLDKYWSINFSNPIYSFINLPSGNQMIVLPILILSLFSLLSYFKSYTKKNKNNRISYYLHASVLLIIYLFHAALVGLPRYALTLIPIYWFMAEISLKSTIERDIISIASLMLLSLGTILFVNWYSFIY